MGKAYTGTGGVDAKAVIKDRLVARPHEIGMVVPANPH